jgi:hypothetical protein
MERQGCQLLHAAAVGTRDGALLITGPGGAGKSTTALACLQAGLDYLADDYLVVSIDPEPTVFSLYCSAKLNADQLEKFPSLADHVSNLERLRDEKAVMYLHSEYEHQMPLAAPIRAVVTPDITGATDTRFASTSRLQLQKAAAFTTLSQLPYAGQRTQTFIEKLIDRLPGLELQLGTDLQGVADAIGRFLTDPAPTIASCSSTTECRDEQTFPLITVVIPVHNGAQFLCEAVDNILSQDYPALEIIIVDDGSTDDIAEVVGKMTADVRFLQQENLGAAAARNRGIRDASGDFIAFLDVDDLWPKNNLRTLLDIMQHHKEIEIVHGYGQLMARNDDSGTYRFVGNPQESYPYYIGAALYRRSAFESVGLFDTDLDFSEDSDWYTRASESGLGIMRLQQVTLLVRRHDKNMTREKSLVELGALRVLKKALDRKRSRTANESAKK